MNLSEIFPGASAYEFFGNNLLDWLVAAAIVVLGTAALRIVKAVLLVRARRIAERTATDLDDVVVQLLDQTKLVLLMATSLYAASLTLALSPAVRHKISTVVVLVLLFQGGLWANRLVAFFIQRSIRKRAEEDIASTTGFATINFVARLVIWAAVALLMLDNLGVNITTLVAGLGVGGIAVALAVQNMLGDLLASVSIILDKPFVAGDYIVVGEHMGTIEKIGVKTTRVRSLTGEQLVFANNDLLQSRIRNYQRMAERRVLFRLGVTYQTPKEKLAKIPEILRGIIEAQGKTRFDRAHFQAFGDFSLNFEVVYYVLNRDYNEYMDIQQAINLAIVERFEGEGLEFAYPTQTLFLTKEESV
ncbi:MAG: mechanosensitive ion channel family protein [Deltaproteobacteria bacterium]|nr:mechanosensitive ion channel family protein [Deltaproteobacteria bacterium]